MSISDRGAREDTSLLEVHPPVPVEAADSKRFRTLWCYIPVMVLVSMYYALSETPLQYLYEIGLCKEYYSKNELVATGHNGMISKGNCTLDPIQADLAMFTANQKQINFAASIIASFYTPLLIMVFGSHQILILNISCHLCAQLWIYSFCKLTLYKISVQSPLT